MRCASGPSRTASDSSALKYTEAVSRHDVREAFAAALDLPAGSDVESVEIGKTPEWDSIAHMALVAELEDRFSIELETDDLIAIGSFAQSIEVLRRYGVEVA
jgi:acyl carrier protein